MSRRRSRYASAELRGSAKEAKKARPKVQEFVNAILPGPVPEQVFIGPSEQVIAEAAIYGGMMGGARDMPASETDAIHWHGLREFRQSLSTGKYENAGMSGSPYSGLGGMSPFGGPYGFGAQTNLTSFAPMWANIQFAPLTLQWITLMYAYTTYGILQRAIDVPVYDAFRGGLDLFSDDLATHELKQVDQGLSDFGILEAFRNGIIWARLFGGGALILNQEGQDYSEPLDFKSLDGPIEIYDATRWEIGTEERFPKSGYYEFLGHRVHMSRVMTLTGKRAPWLIRMQLADWGLSEIQRICEDFNGYIRTKNAIYELMVEAKIDVFKLARLNQQANSPMGTQLTRSRVAQVSRAKSFNNSIVLDTEDDYLQKQIQFNGLAEMKKENRMDMAENIGQPMSKIWGIAASGFASGEDDLESYAANVEASVREPYKPYIVNILKVLSWTLFHGDYHIGFNWKPLRVMTSEQEETIAASKTNRLVALMNAQIISRDEAIEYVRKENLLGVNIEIKTGTEINPEDDLAQTIEKSEADKNIGEIEKGIGRGGYAPGTEEEEKRLNPALFGAESVGDPGDFAAGPFVGFRRYATPKGTKKDEAGW